ncbi:MAG: Gfo/Idh/MocA family protein [Kiritimatiellia bacterium]
MNNSPVFKTSQRIKLGIWGLGRGQNFIQSAQYLNIDIVAGCDVNPAMRDAFRKNAPGATLVTDNEDELLASDIDAVLIATYFPDHAKHAIKALHAGKHVMCEVTSFITPADGVALVEAVEQSGKVYQLLENYPFTKENLYIKSLWDQGFFGEFVYGEFEYVHCCRHLSYAYNFLDQNGKQLLVEPGWRVHHWRAMLDLHYYNTHSLGPLMHITGLRPTEVAALPNSVPIPGSFAAAPNRSTAASLVRMSNGGVMRNLMGNTTMDNHTGGRLWGTKAAVNRMTPGHLFLSIGADGTGIKTEVEPEWPEIGRLAESAGHGGGDFWELYYFAREILTGEKGPWNIYAACDVTLAGILAARSARQNGAPQQIPDFRLPSDRHAYRNDHCNDAVGFQAPDAFPPDADPSLIQHFDSVMCALVGCYGPLQKLFTVLQGMQIYNRTKHAYDRLSIVLEAQRLQKLLPGIAQTCHLAEQIANAYPDSVGAQTIRQALDNIPLEKIYNPDQTIAEINAWLSSIR